jgi:hypothetical protein
MLSGIVVSLVVIKVFGSESHNHSGKLLHFLDNEMCLFTCKILHKVLLFL